MPDGHFARFFSRGKRFRLDHFSTPNGQVTCSCACCVFGECGLDLAKQLDPRFAHSIWRTANAGRALSTLILPPIPGGLSDEAIQRVDRVRMLFDLSQQ